MGLYKSSRILYKHTPWCLSVKVRILKGLGALWNGIGMVYVIEVWGGGVAEGILEIFSLTHSLSKFYNLWDKWTIKEKYHRLKANMTQLC